MRTDDEEIAIIKEAQEGSILAFESIVNKYDRQVLQLAYSLVHNAQDAEDIYQEVFVRVFKSLKRFQFRSQFSTWLYRVVVNYCINYNKRNKRVSHLTLDAEPETGPGNWRLRLDAEDRTPEDVALNRELSNEIQAALEQLSTQQKTVFVLRHFEGHKLREIAAIMGCSEGTVKNYLFRATQKMQRLLRTYAKE